MSSQGMTRCFKYLPFSDDSLRVLSDGTLKYTCPLEFNDPFDCRPAYGSTSHDRLRSAKREIFDRLLAPERLSPSERIRKKNEYIRKARSYFGSEKFQRSILSGVGVVSLSADPTNILMWSHYADFHRGFVVGFSVPKIGPLVMGLHGSYNLVSLPVVYSDTRPEILYGVDDNHEILTKIALTKSLDWAYEKELRVLDQKRGPGVHPYNRDMVLDEVIAGMRMPNDDLHRLSKVVLDLRSSVSSLRDLKFRKAVMAEREYALRVEDLVLQ